jgi:hypothetical protein
MVRTSGRIMLRATMSLPRDEHGDAPAFRDLVGAAAGTIR